MKLISEELQNSGTSAADEEASGYEVTNLFDDEPDILWKATSNDAIITIDVDASTDGAGAFFLGYTNAIGADLTLKQGGSPVDTASYDLDDPKALNRIWYNYDQVRTLATQVVVELTAAAGAVVQAGIARAGVLYTIQNPDYGFKESVLDNGITQRMASGRPRKITGALKRVVNMSMDIDPDDKFLLEEKLRNFDGQGFACLPIHGLDDSWYSGYFMQVDEARAASQYPHYNRNIKTIELEEV